MKLREIAHSRTGDKGNVSNISVIAYDKNNYQWLKEAITPGRVKAHFGNRVKGEVKIYYLPNLAALNVVMYDALCGGVTQSLAVDPHGKCLSSLLLDMEIPLP